MNYLDIEFAMEKAPVLDPGFVPFGVWLQAYLQQARRPFSVAVEREDGKISVHHTFLRDAEFAEANYRYAERLVKFLLWSVGGFRLYLAGDEAVTARLQADYRLGSARDFDAQFMQDVYERPLEVVVCPAADFPQARESSAPVGGHLEGCRIGFDAGGSDRKVSAVQDGVTVYAEEVVWHPKTQEDPQHHYEGIVQALRTAASHLPRVDAIGVSSAGVFIGNSPMVSSLFIRVPRDRREEVKSIYTRAAAELGDVPLTVSNDGDVTALAGSLSLASGAVLGIAMGTSEAAGYVDRDGNILGWFNELAFAPVDLQEEAMQDEWSLDYGVGCKYFSQDAVIKLAPRAGIALADHLTPAEKLREVQQLAEAGDQRAKDIFTSIGVYLAHTIVLYTHFYEIHHLLVLGRVASGAGGDWLVQTCNQVLESSYPDLAKTLRVMLPDEKTRRVGQSVAAASLPPLR